MAKKCHKNAPYLCVPETDKPGYLGQCCCNDWTCPRCGELRAKYEYGRMVAGARSIANSGEQLWFITITCRGDVTLLDAEHNYLKWTHKFLSACNAQARRSQVPWYYACVTERQERGHPHSHLLTTFVPRDSFCIVDDYDKYRESVDRINKKIPYAMRFSPEKFDKFTLLDYHSEWLMLQSVKSGLGVQTRISMVDSVEACSRYIAKYLFKNTNFDVWPRGWKRIRYSNSWPKLEEKKNKLAFPVLSSFDWWRVRESGTLVTLSEDVYQKAQIMMCDNVVFRTE